MKQKPASKKLDNEFYTYNNYSDTSIKKLKTKYIHLKKNIYRNKKWQKDAFFHYCSKARQRNKTVLNCLLMFETQYSLKIASLKSFKVFLSELNNDINNSNDSIKITNRKGKIELKDKETIDEFLIIVKQLKSYLRCNNEEIINVLCNSIYTGYSKSTMLKLYYKYNSDKKTFKNT